MQSATQLKICSWNINGQSQFKLSDDVLGKFFTRFDIILLCETWTDEESKFELKGFTFYNYPRKILHQNAKRSSSGLGIFVRNDIARGVTFLKHNKDIITLIKLDKDYFRLKHHGLLNPPTRDTHGVNQEGNTSPTLSAIICRTSVIFFTRSVACVSQVI